MSNSIGCFGPIGINYENWTGDNMQADKTNTMSNDKTIRAVCPAPQKGRRRTMTPSEKLKKRLAKDFVSKKYIGDILIDDSEYEIIIEEFKLKYKLLTSSYTHRISDVIFAVALVQIGIRFYDGNYWTHVAKVLGVKNLPSNQQTWMGDSLIDILHKYQKISLPAHEKVNNILMHGFVSNFYVNNYFDFLFEYYRLDLDRDIERNNSENLNILLEAMIKNDNTSRTYLLVRQTSDAIANNLRGSKIRIRRFLKMIDKCFWDRDTVISGKNRLTVLFNNWRNESKNFESEYNKYHIGNYSKHGKKSFSSPYLVCDLKNTEFQLILPPQLVKISSGEIDFSWHIYEGEKEICVPANYYIAITGYKTDKLSIGIKKEELFNSIPVQLWNGNIKVRSFKDISADCVRFFDADGDYLRLDALPTGEVYAFTEKDSYMQSLASIDSEVRGDFLLSYFDFQTGDIIRLPDGNVVSIGKKIEEGFSQRGIVESAYVLHGDEHIPIYKSAPTVIVKIQPNRLNGTMIKVNENIYRMFEKKTIEIPLHDRSGEIGYLINLDDFDCKENGIYKIFIDVPNDRTDRHWTFAMINGMKYEFEDSPYIFKSKGTISFDENISVFPKGIIEKNKGENSFNFAIVPNETHLCFFTPTAVGDLELYIEIQVLHWKMDNDEWEIEKPNEVWHSKFPTRISFKYPDESIVLCMNEELDSEYEEPHAVTFARSKTTGRFDCDVTRFKSWFSREQVICTVFIKISGKRIPFIDVVTKSRLVSCFITGDFANNIFNGEFNIIGQACYYTDVEVNETKLIDKKPIIDGKISIQTKLDSGKYKISIFEAEDDETGFGEAEYSRIGEYFRDLIDPYNLQGKTIEISHIIKDEKKQFNLRLNCNYFITDLKFEIPESHRYRGLLVVEGDFNKILAVFPVAVEFNDLNKLGIAYLEFFDDGEPTCFLYDNQRKIIVKNEEKGLPRAVRYRRYEDIYAGGYLYAVEFVANYKMLQNKEKAPQENSVLNNSISVPMVIPFSNGCKQKNLTTELSKELEISQQTYRSIKTKEINSTQQIVNIESNKLLQIRNIGKSAVDEITEQNAICDLDREENCIDRVVINARSDLKIIVDNLQSDEKDAGENVHESTQESMVESVEEIIAEPLKDILDKQIIETSLPPLVLNCLKKAGIEDLRKLNSIIQTKGLKGLNNINKLNAGMKEQVISVLREYGIV